MTYPKWFAKYDDNYHRVTTQPYGVWQGGFRDSTHYNLHEAEQRAYELNFMEENDYWGLTDEGKLEILACLDTVIDYSLEGEG